MGLLGSLFGNKIDYPPLPPENAAHARLEELRGPLEELANRVSDHLEVVPADHEAFVFLGKPPKKFGIAWLHDGKVVGVKEMMEEGHLSQTDAAKLISKLGEAYEHASQSPRYTTEVAGKQVVVIPSADLEHEVHAIIETATHH